MKLSILVIGLMTLIGCSNSYNTSVCMEQVRFSYCEPYYNTHDGTIKYDCTKIKTENKAVYDAAIMACIQFKPGE